MVGRGALREYVRGSLWVLPALSVLAALAAGALLSSVSVGPRSPLAFQGTPDDARTLLLGITGTMVTVIALLLGLTVVALPLSSTQFSPRLLRNFLRDRPNRSCSARLSRPSPTARPGSTRSASRRQPHRRLSRLAVSGAIVLLFVSLGLLVFFADHLVHSIQVDAIMDRVQRNTLAVIEGGLCRRPGSAGGTGVGRTGSSRHSGYVQAVRLGVLLSHAARPGSACGCGPGSANTWYRDNAGLDLACLPGDPAPDPRTSRGSWTRGSGSGSSAPWSRTPRSGSGSSSMWRARRCPRRSTIPTPRYRPSITWR